MRCPNCGSSDLDVSLVQAGFECQECGKQIKPRAAKTLRKANEVHPSIKKMISADAKRRQNANNLRQMKIW